MEQHPNGGSVVNSIEVQIDNFLEHFKRTSKAMENSATELPLVPPRSFNRTNSQSSGPNTTVIEGRRSRPQSMGVFDNNSKATEGYDCLADADGLLLDTATNAEDIEVTLRHRGFQSSAAAAPTAQTTTASVPIPCKPPSHLHHQQHQSSVSSCASVQTVLMQNNTAAANSLDCHHQAYMSHSIGSGDSIGSSNSGFLSSHSQQMPNLQAKGLSSSISLNHSLSESCSSKAENILTVADVAELLHAQYAIITGGRSLDGCSLITFPDRNNFQNLSDVDYQKLIYYLTSVPSLQDVDCGFNLIIDRRRDRWTSVKAVLMKVSCYFPALIHVVYVLRPAGFLQKAISEVSTKFFKEEFRFRLVVCSSLEELYEHVPESQLTSDLGGSLAYSHHEWIQQMISLEKFSSITKQVSSNLDRFIRTIYETEFPNSVEATQNLLDAQGKQYGQLKEEILAAAKHGETLLEDIRSRVNNGRDVYERNGNISAIERLLVQMEETERRFDDYWTHHLNKLKQCLELRCFEQDFRELQNNFEGHLRTLSEMTEICDGNTVDRVDCLIKEAKLFSKLCQTDLDRGEEVISCGWQLIQKAACPKEVVQPKCDELSRIRNLITDRLNKRHEILLKSRELMDTIEKANAWCARGIEILTNQHIEKCSTSHDLAEQSLQEILQFIASATEFKLGSPKEFRQGLEELTIPETKPLVTQVLQRIDDVSLMCDKRIISLKKMALKPPRPVQTVTAIPLSSSVNRNNANSSKRVESPYSRPVEGGTTTDSGVSISGDTISSPDSENTQQAAKPDELENQRLKRGHVLAELLETERIYVAEMGAILKGYRDQIRSEEMATMVPPQLLEGKEDVLFGNLNELYQFHNDVFLKDLENCISTTELVALCFVQRRDTFYRLYSYYCQNIPRSEQLRETLVDTHLFLQECQKRLGHKLPLAAYLLKPVQRITKYQLLLKDLLRFSDNGTCAKELQKALDCMLIVLKCVNDSMHQIAITGFPADLSQQGELLLQDSFTVWTDSKKDMRLRMKTQQRHIFLYQKALLFCKHASKNGHNKSTYQYKHYVKMSQIGLTESVRGDARRFEIWLQGRQEVHTIQAISVEVKNKWVAEIKRVLFNQLEELKGEKIKQYGLNNKQLQHATSWDPTSSSGGPVPPKLSRDSKNISVGETGLIPPNGPAESEGADIIGASSSDYSNSEDEYTHIEEATPGAIYLSMADYCAMSETEVTLKERQSVELLKVGCAGWWFVKLLGGDNQEGWAPAAYLSPVPRNPHILTG